jgi:transposase
MSEEQAAGVGGKRERRVRAGDTPRQQIRKAKATTRRQFSAEEKIRIVMEGIRGEEPVSVICRREGIHATVYYRWTRDALEAMKARLRGDTLREMNRTEVVELKRENEQLKQLVAEYAGVGRP